VNYASPGARPQLSTSPDASLVSFFDNPGSQISFLIGEGYGMNLTVQVIPATSVIIGIESEVVVGDDPNLLTYFINLPPFGRVLGTIPYTLLQFMLGFTGSAPLHLFNTIGGMYPPPVAATLIMDGHFQLQADGPRLFVLGPENGTRKLVQITPGIVASDVRLSGFAALAETAIVDPGLLLARTTDGAGQSAAYVIPLTSGPTTPFSAYSGLGAKRLRGSSDHARAAVVLDGALGDELWLFEAPNVTPELIAVHPSIDGDLEFHSDGTLRFRNGDGTIYSRKADGLVIPAGTFPFALTIL
jgi:hypothetical protein